VSQAPEQLGGVVLAGGRSLRMGRDKAWLEVGGKPLLLRQLGLLTEAGLRNIAIAAGPEDRDPLPCTPAEIPLLRDLHPGLGPLAGVERGLRWARGLRPDPDDGWTLVLAVDLPGMSAGWLRRLIAAIRPGSGCVALHGDRLEPLAAIYPNRSWAVARAHLERPPENPKGSVQEFCRRGLEAGWMVPWEAPPGDPHALVNWNTPSDWSPGGTAPGEPSRGQP
jgi:molybdopterin-guanine dinucleotide biosynthesis protein A